MELKNKLKLIFKYKIQPTHQLFFYKSTFLPKNIDLCL